MNLVAVRTKKKGKVVPDKEKKAEGNLVPKKKGKKRAVPNYGSPYKGADLRVLHSVYTVFCIERKEERNQVSRYNF